eukprot:1155996-Pelagomonas_calceolata.AAC.6
MASMIGSSHAGVIPPSIKKRKQGNNQNRKDTKKTPKFGPRFGAVPYFCPKKGACCFMRQSFAANSQAWPCAQFAGTFYLSYEPSMECYTADHYKLMLISAAGMVVYVGRCKRTGMLVMHVGARQLSTDDREGEAKVFCNVQQCIIDLTEGKNTFMIGFARTFLGNG